MEKLKHVCVVSPNIVVAYGKTSSGPNPKFPHVVHCKACQWQALAKTEEQAAEYVRMHEGMHAND